MREDGARTMWLLLIAGSLALGAGAPGCAKHPPGELGGHGEPLVVIEESVEELPDGQSSVKLVVRGDPQRAAVERLLRRYVEDHRPRGGEMWVALFLEGMDLQSIEYAFAIARPGQPPRITVRESVQTYR